MLISTLEGSRNNYLKQSRYTHSCNKTVNHRKTHQTGIIENHSRRKPHFLYYVPPLVFSSLRVYNPSSSNSVHDTRAKPVQSNGRLVGQVRLVRVFLLSSSSSPTFVTFCRAMEHVFFRKKNVNVTG